MMIMTRLWNWIGKPIERHAAYIIPAVIGAVLVSTAGLTLRYPPFAPPSAQPAEVSAPVPREIDVRDAEKDGITARLPEQDRPSSSALQTPMPEPKPVMAKSTQARLKLKPDTIASSTLIYTRCLPNCESRDPLIKNNTQTPAVVREPKTPEPLHASPAAAHQDQVGEQIFLHARDMLDGLASSPRLAWETGRQAIASAVSMMP